MKLSASAYQVPALEKGLDILELLSRRREAMSLAQIAAELRRTKNELFRMLNCLENRGYLTRDPGSGTYSLTLRLFEMAHTHSPVEHLVKAAAMPMQNLCERLRESCHLSIVRHGELLVVAQADNPDPVRISVEVGSRFPLTKTVSGRLLLSLLSTEEIQGVLHKPAVPMLVAQFAKIRERGYSEAASETFVGLHDLAVAVGRPSIGISAALAITSIVPTDTTLARSRRLTELRRCVQIIHRELGFPAVGET